MGLYDGYQLANSSQIKKYQGSTVPELVQVSQEMQRRYDAAQEGQDYVSRFMNSMQALDSDRGELQKLSKEYQGRLKQIAGRPDQENMLRETTMLGRDLPAQYAPFAQRMKDAAEYQEQLQKDVASGNITTDTAQRMLAYSRHADGGIKRDPVTGKYNGRFQGQMYVKDIDINKWVDEAMKGADPTITGGKVDQVNGQWIVTRGNKTEVLSPETIQKVISSAANADTHFQSWVRQQQNLGTFDKDFSKVDLNSLDMNTQMGTMKKPGGKNGETVPVTLKDMLQQYTDKGYSPAQALQVISRNSISSDIMNRAYRYGVDKFQKNDRTSELGLQANQVWKWNADEDKANKDKQMLQLATTMTLGGAKVENAGDFHKLQTEAASSHNDLMQQYSDWKKGIGDQKVKIPGESGRMYYRDENGKLVDVTKDRDDFVARLKYTDQKKKEMDAVDKAAMEEAGLTPNHVKALEIGKKAYDKAYQTETRSSISVDGRGGSTGGTPFTEAERKANASRAQEVAYRNALQSDPQKYKNYQDALKRRTNGTTMGSDLFAFRDEKTINALSAQIENSVSGLDVEKGLIPVQTQDGSQISADQWEELKGNMKAIGITYSGDPNAPVSLVVRAFKDVKGKKTAGEDMIVKIPNTNAQAIAAEGMSPEQRRYFDRATGLASSLNNPFNQVTGPDPKTGKVISVQANTSDPRGGWTVRVGDKEATLGSFKEIFDYIDTHNQK